MNIAIVNTAGATGKTTLAKHLFSPLMRAIRIQIESMNSSDGTPDISLSAKKFLALAGELSMYPDTVNFVIDIGSSNFEAMIKHFSQLEETRNSIDFWVIPISPDEKTRVDSINTVKILRNMDIPSERIVMILNNVQDVDTVNEKFSNIFPLRQLGVHVVGEVVLESDVYDLLKYQNDSVFDLVNNPIDFKTLKREALENQDRDEIYALGKLQTLHQMAKFTSFNLRAVFEASPMAAALIEF
jgi:hypothetical protein